MQGRQRSRRSVAGAGGSGGLARTCCKVREQDCVASGAHQALVSERLNKEATLRMRLHAELLHEALHLLRQLQLE